ncbi:MAG: phosphoribosylamine---glycine ligase [Thermoplasmata archaeon]|jgi:phosphoribosylamine--glycine ligase|nr:phosphoribosylamine---glycine ligase [Thermoplasmata archaeon]
MSAGITGGDGWEEYTSPKTKAAAERAKAEAARAPDGAEIYTSTKKAAGAPATQPPAHAADGTMELPGSPRPKKGGPTSENPKGEPAGASDAEFRRQAPKSVEEDAEVWDSAVGWTTPSGRKENLAPGVEDGIAAVAKKAAEPAGPTVEADDDTEVITAPKRVLPPEPKAGAPRTGGSLGAAKQGKEGQDFAEYNTVKRAPWDLPQKDTSDSISYQKPSATAGFGSSLGLPPAGAAGTAAPPAGQQKLYGGITPMAASALPPAARPSGKTEIHDPSARPSSPTVAPRSSPATAPPSQVHAAPLPKGQVLNVLLVGSGAREHAMALAIRRSQRAQVFVVMKHRNPGIAKSATGFKILDDRDVAGIVAWARMQKIHLAVVGPETPLEAGVTDGLRAAGIAVASPTQAAARIETSKVFMRDLMRRHGLPGSLAFHPFNRLEEALAFLDQHGPVWAVKPVGLTGGKGVQVHGDHFADVEGAKAYVRTLFGPQGGAVQFEELARGEEFTLMAFTDGTTLLPMPAVQDHKRLLEGDQGPNTGGMGSYTQADGLLPFLAVEDYSAAAQILQGIVDALRNDGTPYVGTIYGQFMLTADGPKIIEVNARFGDPEAMNVLHTLQSDYLGILEGMATGTLSQHQARFRGVATVVKYVVPQGYGGPTPAAGQFIQVDDFNIKRSGGAVYLGSIEQHMSGPLVTMASRTLAVLGEGPTIEAANTVCEASLQHVHGDRLYVRHDIGTQALLERRVAHMAEVKGGQTAMH